MTRFAAIVLVLAGSGLLAFAWWRRPATDGQASRRAAVPRGTRIGEFVLTERSGRPFDSASLKGHVWVASFFFATCPSVCVQQNKILAEFQAEYGKRGLKLVSITCDPQNDSPEALRAYAARFQAQPGTWFFLTGDLTYIRLIGRDAFQVPVAHQTHANRLLLVDRQGRLSGSFNWTDARELAKLRSRIETLLKEAAHGDAPPRAR